MSGDEGEKERRRRKRAEEISTGCCPSQWSPWRLPPLHLSPVGDVRALPLLPRQRISPLP